MRTGIVTGAAKRIGKAIAQGLLREGYHLILHANTSTDELRSWVRSHENRDRVVDIISADIQTVEGQEKVIEAGGRNFDALHVLVNNASVFYPEEFSKISRGSFSRVMSVNLEAPFFITQGLLKNLLRVRSSSVINLLDAMWERPFNNFAHYSASKAGLALLTRALAIELAPDVRVNAVAPGSILPPIFHDQEHVSHLLKRIPQGKLGQTEDIVEAVLYLCERAQYVTGEILVIDGGRSLSP